MPAPNSYQMLAGSRRSARYQLKQKARGLLTITGRHTLYPWQGLYINQVEGNHFLEEWDPTQHLIAASPASLFRGAVVSVHQNVALSHGWVSSIPSNAGRWVGRRYLRERGKPTSQASCPQRTQVACPLHTSEEAKSTSFS